MRGVSPSRAPRRGLSWTLALALKHLLTAARVPVAEETVRDLARRAGLAEPLAIWAYVWELDRRARGKGKGPVVHALWQRMPQPVRTQLTADRVWAAREQLIDAASQLAG